jgi:hypothetical protein
MPIGEKETGRLFAAAFLAAALLLSSGRGFAFETQKQPQPAKASAPTLQEQAGQFDLGNGYKFGLGAKAMPGFATDISQLNTYSLGAALTKTDFAVPGDRLGLQVSKPLRVYPGSAPEGLDEDRRFLLEKRIANPVAKGSETDVTLSYLRPLDEKTAGGFSLSARQDVDNIDGENDVSLMIGIRRNF